MKFIELELVDELKQNAKMGEILEYLKRKAFYLLANKEFYALKTSRKWKKALDGRTLFKWKKA